MATSGSTDFNLTRNQIIIEALEYVGAIYEGETPTAEAVTSAARTLNIIVKAWQTHGLNLWATEWATKTLSASSVVLGTDAVDYECIRNHTSGATTRPVTGGDYSTYWKELSTTAGGAWATATAYTSVCNLTFSADLLEIDEAFVRYGESDYPITIITRQEYFEITSKGSVPGRPTQLYLDRQETPVGFLYPYPDSATDYVIHYAKVRKLEDFDSTLDDADVSQKYYDALVLGLASRLAMKYGNTPQQISQLNALYSNSFRAALADDNERADIQIAPRRRPRRFYGY
jgi:hypothetical protein